MSRSRTGVAALICGLGTVFASKFLMEAVFYRRIGFSVRPLTVAFAFVGVVAAALAYDMTHEGKLAGFVKSFVMKGGAENGISEFDKARLIASRAELIQNEWSNFKAKPWTGIGFGTSTSSYFVENISAFSAPIEKGFLPVGVLEETGIFGSLCFLILVANMFQQLFSQANLAGMALLATYLAVNMGEDMLFSFGGHGAFGWALVVAGVGLGAPFFEEERARRGTNRPGAS
jgi:O-antigen ligase